MSAEGRRLSPDSRSAVRISTEGGSSQRQIDARIAVDVDTAAEMLGISRGALYPLVMAGDVPSFKIGRRRLVPVEALRSWAAGQVDADGPSPATPRR